MTTYISSTLRRVVVDRAEGCCEYCLLDQGAIFLSFEIDHIVAEKYGGATVSENLCWSCPDCNRFKGTDVGSFDQETGILMPLFNPRTQRWETHFRLDGVVIEPLTSVGRVTVRLRQINNLERIHDREIYTKIDHYPCRSVTDRDI